MKKPCLFLLPLFLAACASKPVPLASVPDLARSEPVVVRDDRPPGEEDSKVFSYLITSDAYGILRVNEKRFEPSVLRLLQHRAFERFGPAAQVTVYHFVAYWNTQAQFRSGAVGAVFLGAIGGVIGNMAAQHDVDTSATLVDRQAFDALAGDDEWKRGTFTAAENPRKGSVYVTYLDASVNGQRVFVRVVSQQSGQEGKDGPVFAVERTIREFLDQLGANGQADTGAASPIAAVPAAPASAAVASAEAASPLVPMPAVGDASGRPANVRHLDAAALEGRKWTFSHPTDRGRFRQVWLRFANGRADAGDERSHSSGPYTVKDDMVCIDFESRAWGRTCYWVLDGGTGPGGAPATLVQVVSTGDSAPLDIE